MNQDVRPESPGDVVSASQTSSPEPAPNLTVAPTPHSRPPQPAEAYIIRCPNEILAAIMNSREGMQGNKLMLKAVRQTCARLEAVASSILFKNLASNRNSEGWIHSILELSDSPLQTHVRAIRIMIVKNCGNDVTDYTGCSLRDYWKDVPKAKGAMSSLDKAIGRPQRIPMSEGVIRYYDHRDGLDGYDPYAWGSYGGRRQDFREEMRTSSAVSRYESKVQAAEAKIREYETKLHKALWPTIAIHIAKALPSFTSLNKLEIRSALPVELTPSMAQAMARSSSIRDVRLAFSSYNRKTLDHLLKSKTHKSITLEVYDCDKFLEVIGTKSKWIRKPDEEPKKSFTEWYCVVGKE